jgi:Tol biopolymer transport system component/DNA-binding winged helix-turn-helix (wHTH) protein
MPETRSPLRLVRFGAFEADLRTGELRKDGVKLKFSGQPFQVLAILLERPGDVVTREELQKRLWPDTFVDVERNLNTAVNKIREVLRDSAESPRFVETLPRRGYRFIGELERPVEPSVETAIEPKTPVEPDRGSEFRKLWWTVAASVLTIAIIAVITGGIYRRFIRLRPQAQAALTAVPFTALPGQATAAAFSPDGSRIAFAWNGDPTPGAKGYDLYVKGMGSETLLRLTQHPSKWISAAWSPDGTQIAFHRLSGPDSGLYSVPALGGPEKKLRSTGVLWVDLPTISWSPDGRSIAFSDWLPNEDRTGIYLFSTATGDTERIPNPSKCLSQVQPAFSHRGDYLAYWCFNGKEAVLYALPVQGGKPNVVSVFQDFPTGLTWSANDTKLIFSLWYGLSGNFREVTVADGSVKMLAFRESESAQLPAVSARGDKLAFNSYSSTPNIWHRDLAHPEAPPVELVPSSRSQWGPQYSPDGKRVVFASMRSGVQGVWVSDEDGSNLVQISNPAQPSGSPQWSPDGKKIVFDSLSRGHWEIYVADVLEREPRKLITNISDFARPYWSSDGKWIYFRSVEPGRMGIFRCPASGGDATQISKDIHGYNPRESLDGSAVYFASLEEKSTLKVVALPPQPGMESEVDGLPRLIGAGSWTLSPGGIYFVPANAPRSLRYFDFATKQIRPIFEVDRDFGDISVSPDGRWILYSLAGDARSDIMLVDHYR